MKKIALPLLLLAGGFAAAALLANAAPAAKAGTTVSATLIEFKIALSKPSVPRGAVVFQVVDKGKLPHVFSIAGKKTALLKPGQSATLTVTFAKAGSYPYLCTVPGHAAAGMKGTLTVK